MFFEAIELQDIIHLANFQVPRENETPLSQEFIVRTAQSIADLFNRDEQI